MIELGLEVLTRSGGPWGAVTVVPPGWREVPGPDSHPEEAAVIKPIAIALSCLIAAAGCYHATIETTATPSTETIEQGFASSWIYGLVPPSTVETAAKCTNGVAKVETQISFVNGLVGALTLGIYTPMSIKVTCAAKRVATLQVAHPDIIVASGAGSDAIREAFSRAAEAAAQDGGVVLVQVTD